MKGAPAFFAALLLAALTWPAGAGAAMEQEIGHLMEYITQSDCTFIRNGREYDSAEALEHIAKKYDYVKKRVKKAEDFITWAATKSSMSGKPYLVRCGGEEIPTAEWLKAELARFREAGEPDSITMTGTNREEGEK